MPGTEQALGKAGGTDKQQEKNPGAFPRALRHRISLNRYPTNGLTRAAFVAAHLLQRPGERGKMRVTEVSSVGHWFKHNGSPDRGEQRKPRPEQRDPGSPSGRSSSSVYGLPQEASRRHASSSDLRPRVLSLGSVATGLSTR